MKILYISPENTVGTLTLWKATHEQKGHECRTLTFFNSPKRFKEDICLNLPFNFTLPHLAKLRNLFFKIYRGSEGYFSEKPGYPPIWKSEGLLDKFFLKFKDFLWRPIIVRAIKKYDLYNFDIYHFESGMDFLKDEFFVKEVFKRGKKIICHYHGEDLRNRGVMPIINRLANLNITNEVDLLSRHPKIEYLFLPFEKILFKKRKKINRLIKVYLIEGLTHKLSLERKSKADIFIDQIGYRGGWGYGMNSVESLSMGICTLTEINDSYNSFIPNHPFVNITKDSFSGILKNLILDPNKIFRSGEDGKNWVEKYHDVKNVSEKLYRYYKKIGL